MYLVFRILLSIVHFLNSCYCAIRQTLKSLAEENPLLVGQLQRRNREFTSWLDPVIKIPSHVAVILGQEEISAADLARLVSWCILAKIPHVSFYDHKGCLLENQNFIKKKVSEVEPLVTKKVEWPSLRRSATSNNVDLSDMDYDALSKINDDKTKVQLLSYNDGKEKIVRVTRSLAKVIDSNKIQEKDITPELIDRILRRDIKVPDPDLAIVFGRTLCTYGFLPWQTRITEFFTLPTHHNLSSRNFLDILFKFSKTEQHYGK